ncbi:PD-(D/E)XK motif protein [Pseudomonas sp. CC120222-01a]|uniref:PD-(D/E)XK motif protein n=1 Tax=Pseudomonas sp. CC120222-01a TaxID=1378075 RepID=UPI000DA26137|nr:PD-(D/E)XK motif protein [Pseudomonas sp. CC120222-01a]
MSSKSIWAMLRINDSPVEPFGIRTMPLSVRAPAGRLRLALGPSGEPRILLPLAYRELASCVSVPGSISLTESHFFLEGRSVSFADMTCISDSLASVFGEFVDEIIARVEKGSSCLEAIDSTINDFRSLLSESSDSEVDPSEVIGLVGELLVLNRLLDHSASGWKAWRGPSGDRHDFRNAAISLEVKSTDRVGKSDITINGLEQLEAPSGGNLYLLRIELEPVHGGALSVASLAFSAIGKSDDPVGLHKVLRAAGCEDFQSARWNTRSFRLNSESFYEVKDGFPKLTSAMLLGGVRPAGLFSVKYSVDLSFACDFLQSNEAYRSIELGLSQCH